MTPPCLLWSASGLPCRDHSASSRAPRPKSTSNLTPLLLDVCAEGICLFGDAYFQSLRTLALRALDQSGLQRQLVAGTLMWVFPHARTPNWRLDWNGFHDGV